MCADKVEKVGATRLQFHGQRKAARNISGVRRENLEADETILKEN